MPVFKCPKHGERQTHCCTQSIEERIVRCPTHGIVQDPCEACAEPCPPTVDICRVCGINLATMNVDGTPYCQACWE